MPGGWGAVIVVLHCVAPRAWQSSTSLRETLLPGGWGAAIPFIPLRGALSLPRGPRAVARAGHRAQPSDPPARATEQGRPAPGPLAVRMRPRQRHPAAGRPLGARTRRRDRSLARGADLIPSPRSLQPCLRGLRVVLGWVEKIRPAGGAAIPPSATGTRRAARGGVSVTRSLADTEGPHPGAALPGRGRRSLGAPRAGASKRRAAASPAGQEEALVAKTKTTSPRGNKEAPRSGRRRAPTRPPGKTRFHAVKRKQRSPRGKREARRSGETGTASPIGRAEGAPGLRSSCSRLTAGSREG